MSGEETPKTGLGTVLKKSLEYADKCVVAGGDHVSIGLPDNFYLLSVRYTTNSVPQALFDAMHFAFIEFGKEILAAVAEAPPQARPKAPELPPGDHAALQAEAMASAANLVGSRGLKIYFGHTGHNCDFHVNYEQGCHDVRDRLVHALAYCLFVFAAKREKANPPVDVEAIRAQSFEAGRKAAFRDMREKVEDMGKDSENRRRESDELSERAQQADQAAKALAERAANLHFLLCDFDEESEEPK
jgi:hypothetical protein